MINQWSNWLSKTTSIPGNAFPSGLYDAVTSLHNYASIKTNQKVTTQAATG